MANILNPSIGGALDLYVRVEVPKYAATDSEYAQDDFQGKRRRGYVQKTPTINATSKKATQNLMDIGIRKVFPPDGEKNITVPQRPALSAKGMNVRSGHRIQKNVPLHIDLSGTLTIVTGGSHALVWMVTTIEGITPKIGEGVLVPTHGTTNGVGSVDLKALSSNVLLSKDIDLEKEVDVKTDLYAAVMTSGVSTTQRDAVEAALKTIGSTGDNEAALGSAFLASGTVRMNFCNTVLHLWQPVSGRDVNN